MVGAKKDKRIKSVGLFQYNPSSSCVIAERYMRGGSQEIQKDKKHGTLPIQYLYELWYS
jgi:hypothetical protein